MNDYKLGDRVVIQPGATPARLVGQTLTVTKLYEHGVRAEDGSTTWFLQFPEIKPAPAPAFAPGQRVQATQDSRPTWQRGAEGVVVSLSSGYDARYIAVDFKDGRSPSHYEADELEAVPEPKREPQAGEVWTVIDRPHYVVREAEAADLRIVQIYASGDFNHALMNLDGGYHASFQDGDATFLAPDLASYFKARQ